MFEQQGGVCAACGLPENRMNARLKGRLHVDHDHVTGQVRGLLCANCNAALGLLRDEPQRIEALLAYRLHWKQALKDAHERLRELEAALNALNDELDYHHEREALAEQGEE
jgi:hypothetical protein